MILRVVAAKTEDQNMKMSKDYFDEIARISRLARQWIKDHPGSDAAVQFNYPEDTMLAAVIPDAVEAKLVSYNADGEALLRAMGAFEKCFNMPSTSMCRYALEYLEDIKKEDENAKK